MDTHRLLMDFPLDFQIVPGAADAVGAVELKAGEQKGRAELPLTLHATLSTYVQRIYAGRATVADLMLVGGVLWDGLVSGEVRTLFKQVLATAPTGPEPQRLQIRLGFAPDVSPEIRALPWETLYADAVGGFLAGHLQHSLSRVYPIEAGPRPRLDEAPAILVAIPGGANLDVQREWESLQRAAPSGIRLGQLTGRVTPDQLLSELNSGRWNVLHFIGHGIEEDGRTQIRLNADTPGSELWVDAEAFAANFHGSSIRLAVLNCCSGAGLSGAAAGQNMSGLGEPLLRAGVKAVVAMRYEILDSMAIRFAHSFYSELLCGNAPGRVDVAVSRARQSMFNYTSEDPRGFVTPVVFVARGHELLFDIKAPAQTVVSSPISRLASHAPSIPVPPKLIQALREGRCIPVIGHRVLAADTTRSGPHLQKPGPPSPGQLAREIAEGEYSRPKDFELSDAAGDWLEPTILRWVCQDFIVRRRGEQYWLIQQIQKAYGTVAPPPMISQIARWQVPAFFCLYFDGLLERAISALAPRVVYGVDKPLPPGDGGPLLINMCGSLKDPESLVLTEIEYERLIWERMSLMNSQILAMARSNGRSPIFVGASPRDTLTRRFADKLLRDPPKTMGSVYVVCRPGEENDPVWADYQPPVVWVPCELEEMVTALTTASLA